MTTIHAIATHTIMAIAGLKQNMVFKRRVVCLIGAAKRMTPIGLKIYL